MVQDIEHLSQAVQQQFCDYLENTIGLYVPLEHWPRVQRKLRDIATSFGFENVNECIHWILKTPLARNQISILVEHLAIKESYFFRYPQIFDVLSQHVLSPMIQSRLGKNQRIRILCTASSTGEEPYSLAMTIHKLLPNIHDWDISILGTDINLKALEVAREAKYREWSMRATAPDVKQKYFTVPQEGVWELSMAIRNMVKFAFMNLVEEINFAGFDIIFCCNTLIYFSPKQIEKTISKLTDSLVEGGWLCVSAVEVPLVKDPRLVREMFDGVTLFRKK